MKRRTIALMFCGGGLLSDRPAAWERVRKSGDMARWLAHVPELHLLADIEPHFIAGTLSTAIGPDEWRAIAGHVRSVARRVDGVLVLHGIETIHYSANALSLMLRRLPFPVVLSGSPHRAGGGRVKHAEFGVRANVINAAQVALADLTGVFVVFGNRIMQGSRVQLEMFGDMLHVTTVDRSLVGRIDFGITLAPERGRRSRQPMIVADRIEANLFTMSTAPGSTLTLRRALEAGIKGVLIRTTQDYLMLGNESLDMLRDAAARGIPVIVATPRPVANLPKEFCAIVGVSPSMAVVKSMWAIGNAKNRSTLRTLLSQRIAGEQIIPGGIV